MSSFLQLHLLHLGTSQSIYICDTACTVYLPVLNVTPSLITCTVFSPLSSKILSIYPRLHPNSLAAVVTLW